MVSRVLVTGASGFIGRAVIPYLCELNFEVHAITRRETCVRDNLQWWHCDLFERDDVDSLLRSVAPTHLLHLAWITQPGAFWSSITNIEWLRASQNLILSFRRYGGARVVGIGTCAEYDWLKISADGLLGEECLVNPASLYGQMKRELGQWLSVQDDLSVAWARLFYAYGPGESDKRLVPSLILSLLHRLEIDVGSPSLTRDYLYVDDLGLALSLLVASDLRGAFNVASGQPITLSEIVDVLTSALGGRKLIRFGGRRTRPEEPRRLVADISKVSNVLHFSPTTKLSLGLEKTIGFWRGRVDL